MKSEFKINGLFRIPKTLMFVISKRDFNLFGITRIKSRKLMFKPSSIEAMILFIMEGLVAIVESSVCGVFFSCSFFLFLAADIFFQSASKMILSVSLSFSFVVSVIALPTNFLMVNLNFQIETSEDTSDVESDKPISSSSSIVEGTADGMISESAPAEDWSKNSTVASSEHSSIFLSLPSMKSHLVWGSKDFMTSLGRNSDLEPTTHLKLFVVTFNLWIQSGMVPLIISTTDLASSSCCLRSFICSVQIGMACEVHNRDIHDFFDAVGDTIVQRERDSSEVVDEMVRLVIIRVKKSIARVVEVHSVATKVHRANIHFDEGLWLEFVAQSQVLGGQRDFTNRNIMHRHTYLLDQFDKVNVPVSFLSRIVSSIPSTRTVNVSMPISERMNLTDCIFTMTSLFLKPIPKTSILKGLTNLIESPKKSISRICKTPEAHIINNKTRNTNLSKEDDCYDRSSGYGVRNKQGVKCCLWDNVTVDGWLQMIDLIMIKTNSRADFLAAGLVDSVEAEETFDWDLEAPLLFLEDLDGWTVADLAAPQSNSGSSLFGFLSVLSVLSGLSDLSDLSLGGKVAPDLAALQSNSGSSLLGFLSVLSVLSGLSDLSLGGKAAPDLAALQSNSGSSLLGFLSVLSGLWDLSESSLGGKEAPDLAAPQSNSGSSLLGLLSALSPLWSSLSGKAAPDLAEPQSNSTSSLLGLLSLLSGAATSMKVMKPKPANLDSSFLSFGKTMSIMASSSLIPAETQLKTSSSTASHGRLLILALNGATSGIGKDSRIPLPPDLPPKAGSNGDGPEMLFKDGTAL
ncbi:hypothetical protein WICPIJ_008659 [Wickerhamomyces pijperi]|uniref:Uncharacterized protein n=1 Tax=Wickerhamomyces pijperi TaxID=599730 RepID=A0A9P8PVT5_WICPI|nr:hypothetical protein WICPIJ_008659 [Wickerhamomyces pijperi]